MYWVYLFNQKTNKILAFESGNNLDHFYKGYLDLIKNHYFDGYSPTYDSLFISKYNPTENPIEKEKIYMIPFSNLLTNNSLYIY